MWVVGFLSKNKEHECIQELNQKGYEAFSPVHKVWTKPNRKKKAILVLRRMFPGYVFLNVPENFNSQAIRFKKFKLSLLCTYDDDGEPIISKISDEIVNEIFVRGAINDLFDDYDKKNLRKVFYKNQLVCWRNSSGYMLGFVTEKTEKQPFVCVKVAKGKELKILVDLVSLL